MAPARRTVHPHLRQRRFSKEWKMTFWTASGRRTLAFASCCYPWLARIETDSDMKSSRRNIAFRRSRLARDIDLAVAQREALPFVARIIARVSPRLIFLTGVNIDAFVSLYARGGRPLAETVKDPGINHVVFAATAAHLISTDYETIVVQVAHASQFAWTYARYGVSARIVGLMGGVSARVGGIGGGDQSTSGSIVTALPSRALGHGPEKDRPGPATRWSNPRLAELETAWIKLGISHHFHLVHHSANPKFSAKRETLNGFISYCDCRDIKAENNQTLDRALDVARRVEMGLAFKKSLEDAWAAYPTVTR